MKFKKVVLVSLISVAVLFSIFWLWRFFFKPKYILLRPKETSRAEVAIVVDDWGYNLRCIGLLKEIDIPLTISILPNLRYSLQIAEVAKNLGKEVIVHLPLEPENEGRNIGLEKYTITTSMSEEEIIKDLERALGSVPYMSGVSNHMGSRATKDSRVMTVIFRELKKRKLYFLDNLVSNKSICRQLATKLQLGFTVRDFFLDNTDDYEYVKEQFAKLSEFALENKRAVAIIHARPLSLEVLQEEFPLMQARRIKFVFVSDLLE